jgi:hypothetical protein
MSDGEEAPSDAVANASAVSVSRRWAEAEGESRASVSSSSVSRRRVCSGKQAPCGSRIRSEGASFAVDASF